MAIELYGLLAACTIYLIQLFLATALATKQRGVKWNMSPREESVPPLMGYAGRCDRSFQNLKETFPLFLASIALVVFSGKMGEFSKWGAMLYVVARVFYIPAYMFAITGLRSLIWMFSVIGICLILLQVIAA